MSCNVLKQTLVLSTFATIDRTCCFLPVDVLFDRPGVGILALLLGGVRAACRHGGMTKSPCSTLTRNRPWGGAMGGVRVGSFCSKICLTWAGGKVPFPTSTRHATMFRTCRYKKLLPLTTMESDERGGGCKVTDMLERVTMGDCRSHRLPRKLVQSCVPTK
eukprot:scaffold594281_cov55-Attheya_sp.AAC.4